MTDKAARRAPGKRLRCALTLGLALAVLPAAAHKLEVFAFADGARIEGSAYFAGGGKAQGATIEVRDLAGRALARFSPGADGDFVYVAQAPADHVIVAQSGDGHRAEWRVSAAELAPGFPGAALAPRPPADPPASPAAAAAPPATQSGASPLDPALEAAIERALARQVRPLREALVAAQDQARLHDILGGIGYILGLVGVALWLRARGQPAGR